jgi:hypothetical protein
MNQPIQELLQTELHNLQKGLNELKPAVDHIKIASDTTKIVVAVAEESNKAVANLQLAQEEYYENLKRVVDKFLIDLQINHHETIDNNLTIFRSDFEENLSVFRDLVNTTIANFEGNIQSQLDKVHSSVFLELQDVQQVTTKIFHDFSYQINEQKKIFDNLFSDLKSIFDNAHLNFSELLNRIENTLRSHNELTQKHIEAYSELVYATNKLLDKIDRIDFPNRLDKIDNTISAINLGISQLNLKLEPLERNIKDYQDLKQEEILLHQRRKHVVA